MPYILHIIWTVLIMKMLDWNDDDYNNKIIFCNNIYVVASGIGIGIALSESGKSSEDVTSTVLQGMAAGTLLYVVFFEVLARERGNRHNGIWQLFAILAGFAVMFTLQIASELLFLICMRAYLNWYLLVWFEIYTDY